MQNFCLYNEFILERLLKKGCSAEQSLSDLKGKRIAFDTRWFISYHVESTFKTSESTIEKLVENLLAKLKKAGINPIFVFGGIGKSPIKKDHREIDKLMKSVWSLRAKRVQAESLAESLKRRDEIKRIKRLLAYCLQYSPLLLETFMYDILIKMFNRLDVDYLIAPQLREAQLLSLYREGYIDAIVGSPICLFLGDIKNIISSIDFDKSTFNSISEVKILEVFRFSDVKKMKEMFLISACLFELDSFYERPMSFLEKIENISLDEFNSYQSAYEKKIYSNFDNMIKVLITQLDNVDLNNYEAVSKRLETFFPFERKTFKDLLFFLKNSLTYSLLNSSVNYCQEKNPFILDVYCDELIILFCLGIVERKFLSVFSSNFNYQYLIDVDLSKSDAFFNINCGVILNAIKQSIKSCSHIIRTEDINFSFKISSRIEVFRISSSPNEYMRSFACYCNQPSLPLVLKEFAMYHDCAERYVSISSQVTFSKKCLLEHLYIKFLDSVEIISLEKRSISPLGLILMNFEDKAIFQKLVYFAMLTKVGATGFSLPYIDFDNESSPSSQQSSQSSEVPNFKSWDMGIQSFHREFQKHQPNINIEEHFYPLEDEVQLKIRLVSRLIELVEINFIWHDRNDYDRTQFVRCYGAMREGLFKTFEAELLSLLLHFNSHTSFDQLRKLSEELPFQNMIFTSLGPLFSMWLGKYAIYRRILAKDQYQKEALCLISIPYVRRYYNISANLYEEIQPLLPFLDAASKFIQLCLSHPDNPMSEHETLMQQYLTAIEFFNEFYTVISQTAVL